MARFGFTTGSCAAAAAKAAAYMLLTGKIKDEISIITPKGIVFNAKITDIKKSERKVSCAVIKDGGDDPDVTTGAHIVAEVSFDAGDADECIDGDGLLATGKNHADGLAKQIIIDGGEGVGRVTRPGLDQAVGNAAINSVPRRMIEEEVTEVLRLCDFTGRLRVIISVPEGKELAGKTFNARLGIVGGISILGTSGIVEPMSDDALVATIRTELNQKKALLWDYVPVSPGNYGLDFMKRTYGFDLDVSVKCSNFVGECIDMVNQLGFNGMLLTGHIGKLVKLAGGMMNTHSKYGDNRMQVICDCIDAVIKRQNDALTIYDVDKEKLQETDINPDGIAGLKNNIMNCVATEDAVDILDEFGRGKADDYKGPDRDDKSFRNLVMEEVMERIVLNLYKHSMKDNLSGNISESKSGIPKEHTREHISNNASLKKCRIECMMYSNKHGMLAKSADADGLLEEIKKIISKETNGVS